MVQGQGLPWAPREENVEAAALTNVEFGAFSEFNRIHVAWEDIRLEVVRDLLKVEADFRASLEQLKSARLAAPPLKKTKRKAKEAWG